MKKIEIIISVLCLFAIIMVGYEVVDVQAQANEEFVRNCNDKFGEDN